MKKSMSTLTSLTLIVLLLTIASCQQNKYPQGKDWLTWKGPFANGTTNETGWNADALSDSTNILWKTDIGKGHSAVAVKGDLVYVFGNKTLIEKTDTNTYDQIACLDANNGNEIWNYKYKSDEGRFPGPCSSPVIEDNNLYSFGRNGHLHCLNTENGKVIWKQQLAEMGYQVPNFGFSASPVILKDMLILKVGETGIAFNKQTGEKIWASDTAEYNVYSSGVVCNYNGNEKILLPLGYGDSVVIVEPETGQILKEFPWTNGSSEPLINDSTVLLSNSIDGTALFDISENEPQQIWKNDSIKGYFQGYTKYGKYAFGFTFGRKKMPLMCINLENGEIEWQKDLDKWGSLSIADDKLIIITGRGQLIIAEASPEKFIEISKLQLFEIDNEEFKRNKNCCWTTPVLSHGKIFTRTAKGILACVNVRI